MKALSLISTGVLVLLLGAVAPTYAQEEKQEPETKPPKQEEPAKPKEQEKAKPTKQEPETKPPKQEQPANLKSRRRQSPPNRNKKPSRRNRNSSKPRVSSRTKHKGSGPTMVRKIIAATSTMKAGLDCEHHARFEEHGGREYNGRREYSYGGYWFYAGSYPAWFYQQDVYFIMGADGVWYAVAYGNPSLTFQVNIE